MGILKNKAEAKKITFVEEFENLSDSMIYHDEQRIMQILLNL